MALRSTRPGAILRVSGLAVLFFVLPFSARANPHELPFTYPYMTLQQGQLELEEAIDVTPLPKLDDVNKLPDGWTPRTTFTTELEYGLTDRLEASLYLVLGNNESQTTVVDAYRFGGLKQRLRYRLFDPGVLPVDLSFYLEAEEYWNQGPSAQNAAGNSDVFELEWKINLERRIGPVRLLANLWMEHESYWDKPDGGRQEWELNPTFGAAVSLSPHWSVGVENWLHTEFAASGAGTQPGDPFFTTPVFYYVGPTAMFQAGPFWISAAVYTRVSQLGTDVGLETDAGGMNVYGRFWFRSMIGINL